MGRPLPLLMLLGLAVLGCGRGTPPRAAESSTEVRIVAIGDLHGDLAATRAALRLAGAIDQTDRWIGGALVVVQTGDQLDRGDDEEAILELLERLEGEAAAAGGALHALNGNHEIMNVAGDFRYVTPGGFADFGGEEARAAAFRPGGPWARRLARRSTWVVVGDTIFVHGGVLPEHARYGLAKADRELKAWMVGSAPEPPAIMTYEDGPIWTRRYAGDPPAAADCAALGETLELLAVRRMVVGHTVQRGGVTSACNGRVWRIDVGLAALYGGPIEVLELRGDVVRAITGVR